MRSNLDNNLITGAVIGGALRYNSEQMAIVANVTLALGMPYLLAFDPGATNRNVTLYTPTVTSLIHEHEIVNYSTGIGVLSILSPAAATIGTVGPGQRAIVRWFNGAWGVFTASSGVSTQTNASKQTLSLYSTLAGLVNTNVLAMKMPFGGTLNLIGFRTRTPAVTAAKAATLTAQINATPVTGGVLSLTSANMTPTNTRVDSTAITALNVFTAGQTIGAVVSAVTAFAEGDGYLEFDVTNTDLRA